MNKLLIASTNQAKLSEYKKFLSDVPIELVSLSNLSINRKARETGNTLEENALIKARFYSKLSGLPALADDGGFEIDALGGEPGVKSHRWVNKDREDTDEETINEVMKRLTGVPLEKRGAQLSLVLAVYFLDKQEFIFKESIRGIIPFKASKKRQKGFPYRSVLYFPDIGKYYSELTEIETKQYNHRVRSAQKLKPFIKEKLC